MARAKKRESTKKRAVSKKRAPVQPVEPAAPKRGAPKRATPKGAAPKRKASKVHAPVAASEPKARVRAAVVAALQRPRVVTLGEVLAPDATAGTIPDSPEFARRVLAEGDSWCSIVAVPGTNLLQELRFAQPTVILNIAEPGDTILRMSTLAKNPWLQKLIADRNFASKWDLILLSGGGNDLIDSAAAIIKAPAAIGDADPVDYVDERELDALVASVQDGYRRMVALRDLSGSSCIGKPVVTHTYDYPTPRPAPARFGPFKVLGPWLNAALENRGTPHALRGPITALMLDRLAEGILALADELANFHVVDTRRTLTPASPDATGSDADWENEIHPNLGGYRKLSEVISPEIRALLA